LKKLRWSMSCLGALALLATACGRSDDADTGTTTAAPATAAPATTTAGTDTTVAGDSSAAPTTTPAGPGDHALTSTDIAEQCAAEPPQATEVGISADEITIEVMADIGSPLAPGLFQANVDAIEGFAEHINANGGIGCRQLVVRTWDSKLDPTEAKNGQIDACANAVAMVGNNSLYNPDPSAMNGCIDLAGQPTGLPNMAALVQDSSEQCSPMTFSIQYRTEQCPIEVGQPRDFNWPVGPVKKLAELNGDDLHGVYLVPGDLPTTRQSAVPNFTAQESIGVTFDAKVLASGRDEQSAYTPRVQYLKEGGNYVYNGANDVTMVRMMKEAQAQGVDTNSVVWACSIACYTQNMLAQGGAAVEGAYMWMQFLQLEETAENAALQAYVDAVGADEADTFGAQAWQAAIAFQQVVNQIVADEGPNAITRAKILAGLEGLEDFTADGWAGGRNLRGVSPCFVLVQVRDGQFARAWPEETGTLDCDAGNLVPVTVDPVAGAEALG
jgi:ABC-type branched-subunit amino acid transport system substrate-binding protein